jgi:uncharacterized membrane protein
MSRERRSVARRMAFLGAILASAVTLVALGWGRLIGALPSSGVSSTPLATRQVSLRTSAARVSGVNKLPGLINLTQSPADDVQPTWAPQGDKIAFLSNGRDNDQDGLIESKGSTFSLFTMGTDGGSVTRYPIASAYQNASLPGTEEITVLGLAWRSDGSAIFVTVDDPSTDANNVVTHHYSIRRVDLTTNPLNVVTIVDSYKLASMATRLTLGEINFLSLAPNNTTIYFEMKEGVGGHTPGNWNIFSHAATADSAPFYKPVTKLTGVSALKQGLTNGGAIANNRHPVPVMNGNYLLFESNWDRASDKYALWYMKPLENLSFGADPTAMGRVWANPDGGENYLDGRLTEVIGGERYLTFTTNANFPWGAGGARPLDAMDVWYVKLDNTVTYPRAILDDDGVSGNGWSNAPRQRFFKTDIDPRVDPNNTAQYPVLGGQRPNEISLEAQGAPYTVAGGDSTNTMLLVSNQVTTVNADGNKEIYLASLVDVQSPYIAEPPTAMPKVVSPGETVTITVPVVDTDTGVRHVWLQIKDPDNDKTDIQAQSRVINMAKQGDARTTLNWNSYATNSVNQFAPIFDVQNMNNSVEVYSSPVPVEFEAFDPLLGMHETFVESDATTYPDAFAFATSDNTASVFGLASVYGTYCKEGQGYPETPNRWVEMFDDGATNGDAVAGDGIYTYNWVTPGPDIAGDWYFDVIVEDFVDVKEGTDSTWHGYRRRFDNVSGCSTLPTFNGGGRILFVDDYADGQRAVYYGVGGNQYTASVDASFLNGPYYFLQADSNATHQNPFRGDDVDVWRVMCRGTVPENVLQGYLPAELNYLDPADGVTPKPVRHGNQCVVWVSPSAIYRLIGPYVDEGGHHPDDEYNIGSIINPDVTTRLKTKFLDKGGRLFMIGYDLPTGLTKFATAPASDGATSISGREFLEGELGATFTATDMTINPDDPISNAAENPDTHYDFKPGLIATQNWYGRIAQEDSPGNRPLSAWFVGEYNAAHAALPHRNPDDSLINSNADVSHDHNVLTLNWNGARLIPSSAMPMVSLWDRVRVNGASATIAFQLLDGNGRNNNHGNEPAQRHLTQGYAPSVDAPIVGLHKPISADGSRRVLWTFGYEHLSSVYRDRPVVDTLDWMKDYTASGRVTALNPNGPLPNALVTITGGGTSWAIRTNQRGEYTLKGLRRGTSYTVTVDALGYFGPNTANITVGRSPLDITGINFALYRDVSNGTIWGYVRQNGLPVANAKVNLRDKGGPVVNGNQLTTDINGRYSFINVPAIPTDPTGVVERYVVYATPPTKTFPSLDDAREPKLGSATILYLNSGESKQVDLEFADHAAPILDVKTGNSAGYIEPDASLQTEPNTSAIYEVRLKNESDVAERYVLQQSGTIPAGWTVRYVTDLNGDGYTDDDTEDITDQVASVTGYTTPTFVAKGEFFFVDVKVTPAVPQGVDPEDTGIFDADCVITLNASVKGALDKTDAVELTTRALNIKPDLAIGYDELPLNPVNPVEFFGDGYDCNTVDNNLFAIGPFDVNTVVDEANLNLDPGAVYFVTLTNRSNVGDRAFVVKSSAVRDASWQILYKQVLPDGSEFEITDDIDSAAGWMVDGDPTTVPSVDIDGTILNVEPLQAGATVTVKIYVRPLADAAGGSSQEVILDVSSPDFAGIRDLVQCTTNVVTKRQPDLKIRRGDDTSDTGDNDYLNLQSVDQTKEGGELAVYYVTLENDGNIADTFTLRMEPDPMGWVSRVWIGHFDNGEFVPDEEITGELQGGGWTSDELQYMTNTANGWVDSVNFKVEVTPTAPVAFDVNSDYTYELAINAELDGGGLETDAVEAATTVVYHAPNGEISEEDVVLSYIGRTSAVDGSPLINSSGEDQSFGDENQPIAIDASKSFYINVWNDGNQAETFTVNAEALTSWAGELADWDFTITDITAGLSDVITTTILDPAGWSTGELAAGTSKKLLLVITPKATAYGAADHNLAFTFRITSDGLLEDTEDVVKAVVYARATVDDVADLTIQASTGTAIGAGLYEPDPNSTTQIAADESEALAVTTYVVEVTNHGNCLNAMTLKGAGTWSGNDWADLGFGWQVRYFDSTGASITEEMTSNEGWSSMSLDRDTSGTITIEVMAPAAGVVDNWEMAVPVWVNTQMVEQDKVSAQTTLRKHWPDLKIAFDGAEVGDNLFTPDTNIGAQTRSSTIDYGAANKAVYTVTLENQGNKADTYALSLASHDAIPDGWTVTLLDNNNEPVQNFVTAGWVTPLIAGSASIDLTLEVEASTTLDGDSALALVLKAARIVDDAEVALDQVQAITTVESQFKTNLQVGYLNDANSFVGGAVINETGLNQVKTSTVGPSETATFLIKVANEGNLEDNVTVTSPQDPTGLWTINYFEDTTALAAAGQPLNWTTTIARAATKVVKVQITPSQDIPIGTRLEIAVTGTSLDGNVKDVVKIKVIARGETMRVSVPDLLLTDMQGNAESAPWGGTAINGSGRFAAFASKASNLVSNDTNDKWDVFVHDRQTGLTRLISRRPNGPVGNGDSGYYAVAMSANGNHVAFRSVANNLVVNDRNSKWDIFVASTTDEWQTYAIERVSVSTTGGDANSNSGLFGLAISPSGRFVAFESVATNLVTGIVPTNINQVYLVDRQATGQKTQLVSCDSAGNAGNQGSKYPSIAEAAGKAKVAFSSDATNLTANPPLTAQIYVRDLTGVPATVKISAGTNTPNANARCVAPSISADGRYVAFESYATNLVAGDTNKAWDIFVRDSVNNTTVRASVGLQDGAVAQANSSSYGAVISDDGKVVAFRSYATNLVANDTNRKWDVFTVTLVNGLPNSIQRVSMKDSTTNANGDSGNYGISLSAGGHFVAFWSVASNLVPNDTNGQADVFVRERASEYKPDLKVNGSVSGTFEGDGIYEASDANPLTQRRTQTSLNGLALTYDVTVENDGDNAVDTVNLHGAASSNGWTVAYFTGTDFSTNITAAITAVDGWDTPALAMGATTVIRVVITPMLAATETLAIRIWGESRNNTEKEDAIELAASKLGLSVALAVTQNGQSVTDVGVGSSITLTATPSGIVDNVQYRFFWEYNNGTVIRTYLTSWGATNTTTWRVPMTPYVVTMGVVGRVINTTSEKTATVALNVTPITAVTLAVQKADGTNVFGNTAVSLTATGTTAAGILEYQFLVDGNVIRDWGVSTATWNTTRTAGTYAVQVKAKVVDSAPAIIRSTSENVPLINPAVASVNLNVQQVGGAGTPVTLTGTATTTPAGGGANEYSFRYRRKVGGAWDTYVTLATNQDSNVGVTPILIPGEYQFIVYSREEGSTATWATQKYKLVPFIVQ